MALRSRPSSMRLPNLEPCQCHVHPQLPTPPFSGTGLWGSRSFATRAEALAPLTKQRKAQDPTKPDPTNLPVRVKQKKQTPQKLLTPDQFSSRVAPRISTLLSRLTNLSPRKFDMVFRLPDSGPQKLQSFTRLHSALQKQDDPEEIWQAYQNIRITPADLQLLALDVLRLLVIYFKDATSKYRKQKSVEKIWAARVISVLVDMREHHWKNFSKWDSSNLVSALNRLGRYEEAIQEIDRVIAEGSALDPILLNHLVRAWGGLEQLDKAITVIRTCKDSFGIKPSEYTLGYLLQQSVRHGHQFEIQSLWKELSEETVIEDIGTIDGVLRSCVKAGNSDFAQTVYDSIPGFKLEPSIESLNLMLALSVSEIQYPEERAQFLETINRKIQRNDRLVYNKPMLDSIMAGFSKKGDVEGAILVHQLKCSHGYNPTIEDHNIILRGFIALGQMDSATTWLQQMRRTGFRPDRWTFTLFVQHYSRQRMPRETEALFRQLIVDGVRPDLAICNHLLLAYEQAKMNRRCLQLYRSMFNDRIGLDTFSFSCMFNAVFHNDKALLEGTEGLDGSGSVVFDLQFLQRISEPIGRSSHAVVGMDSTQVDVMSVAKTFQFDNIPSSTTTLDPRSLFRDMIIVGIRPSQTLFSNIFRAFYSQDDFAGAAVALRTLVDYYSLKVTPKMNAIIVSWVCQYIERQTPDIREKSLNQGELSKLVHLMGRTRGLIDVLERLARMNDMSGTTRGELLDVSTPEKTLPEDASPDSTDDTTMVKTRDSTEPILDEAIATAKQEMGGDIVDLGSRGLLSGSFWTTNEDVPAQLDLRDFERWYQAYYFRTTRAQAEASRAKAEILV
ncbi:hypothetical protein BGW38_010760 [Lunasporangiospora selenospora]|uniref:Pentatricopeptide repeat protein n=1 Tax=Lunasporangiospora selenospora TaxID=979761 RepID=A0A9P6KFB7_9FUNG|nr:hypothetical protein BGW38_010760 [Lunasporangiospora selenospora]